MSKKKDTKAACDTHFLCPGDTAVPVVGRAKVPSPLEFGHFRADDDAVLVDIGKGGNVRAKPGVSFEEAGPREMLYFDPSKTKCGIVTCGGLCPGLNDVIRAIVMEAHYNYRAPAILGFRFGLEGFIPSYGHEVLELTPNMVSKIHEFGGTMLGSSRGPQEPGDIVDGLERLNVSILFMIGGDGTMRAAAKVMNEVKARGRKLSVIGVPKTIDNDINFVAPSFGFDSAVDKATEAIRCAHSEALGAPRGIGVVKLMGRDAGFIAAQATLALKDVNFVLIPEDDFDLHGDKGLLGAVYERIQRRGHAVVVVAEGAGQNLVGSTGRTDASGNPVLADFPTMLIQELKDHFRGQGQEPTIKFIDPSYIIRSVAANSNDKIYCGFLGQNAVHAGMAGKTGMVVTRWNGHYVHVPLGIVTARRKTIDLKSNFWRAVLDSTGQPARMKNG